MLIEKQPVTQTMVVRCAGLKYYSASFNVFYTLILNYELRGH